MATAGNTPAPPLVVVDATAYLFRSFHAIRDLRTRDGVPTNAVFGMAMTLANLRDTQADAAFACVMDAPGPTFRHVLYPAYKANRKKTDPDLIAQIAPVKELIVALGMSLYCIADVEADDVIATIAIRAIASGRKCLIATSDKDLMYLAGKGCHILDPNKNAMLDATAVHAKYGVLPGQMLDYLCLLGDSVDNIPGVPGVGAKTAAKWLGTYGSLEAILANRDNIKGKVGERLRESLAGLALARKLIVLREDVDIEPAPEELVPPLPQREQLTEICVQLKFNDSLRTRLTLAKDPPAPATTAVTILHNADSCTVAAQQLATSINIGLHCEISGDDAPSARLVGVGIYADGHNYYLPFAHELPLAQIDDGNAPQAAALALLRSLIISTDREIRLFGAKEALHALTNAGLQVQCRLTDVALLAFCQDSTSSANLDAVARRFLDYGVSKRSDYLGGRNKPKEFAQLSINVAAPIASLWAQATHDLREPVCNATSNATLGLYRQVEQPASTVLVAMERAGITLDTARLGALDTQLNARMTELEETIATAAGERINLNSPAQLAALLYDRLGLHAGRQTTSGARSTNETELERLVRTTASPVPQLVLDYRHAAKLVGTYTSALPKRINATTGRVHTHFIQAGAVTGRLASKDPNLQNIPIRSAAGRQIRACFIAPPGRTLLSADYSQIELRVLAHFSCDATLLASFAAGEDIHARTAAAIYGVVPADVNADMRRFAKTINFGLIYGMGAFGLASRLNISRAEATVIIDRYFANLPGVRDYLDAVKLEASKAKAINTLFGRVIAFGSRGHEMQRAAINAPMQGTAADIMKLALSAVHEHLHAAQLNALILLQVHDELLLEVADSDVDAVANLVTKVMCGVCELKVPLTVNIATGANWDEAH